MRQLKKQKAENEKSTSRKPQNNTWWKIFFKCHLIILIISINIILTISIYSIITRRIILSLQLIYAKSTSSWRIKGFCKSTRKNQAGARSWLGNFGGFHRSRNHRNYAEFGWQVLARATTAMLYWIAYRNPDIPHHLSILLILNDIIFSK